MSDNEQRIRPFSNGSQFMDWQNANCCKCSKVKWGEADFETECPILKAVSFAAVDDGTVNREIADRMGYSEFGAHAVCYNWPCPERTSEKGEGWDLQAFREALNRRSGVQHER